MNIREVVVKMVELYSRETKTNYDDKLCEKIYEVICEIKEEN